MRMKTKFAIKWAGGNDLIHESNTITDVMRQYIQAHPTNSIIQRSKSKAAQGSGFIYVNLK